MLFSMGNFNLLQLALTISITTYPAAMQKNTPKPRHFQAWKRFSSTCYRRLARACPVQFCMKLFLFSPNIFFSSANLPHLELSLIFSHTLASCLLSSAGTLKFPGFASQSKPSTSADAGLAANKNKTIEITHLCNLILLKIFGKYSTTETLFKSAYSRTIKRFTAAAQAPL